MPLIASAPLETAPAVLEIGLLLLLAVAAGWLARRLGLPAVVGYLVVGLIVSPFTPGYVADRRQLQVLADVGVVLLLFEVDPAALPRALPWIGFLLAAVVVAKALPAAGLSRLARLPDVRHWQLGIGLAQVGEFSFVLAGILVGRALIPAGLFTAVLATVVITIAGSAVLVRMGKRGVPEPSAAT